jgi:DNA-binding CsgD family transcriptional regulator/sugar-specific transcriptional regulator TrmB
LRDTDPLRDQLCALGLSGLEAGVYVALLRTGPQAPAGLGRELGMRTAEVGQVVTALAGWGLATRPGPDLGEVAPLDPAVAVRQLAARREAELASAAAGALSGYEAYRRRVGLPAGSDVVEIISGDVLQQKVVELEQSATQEIRSLDTAPYGSSEPDNPTELANLRRGVRYRVVYARASVELAEFYQRNILPCTAAGEQARVVPSVPAKLMIIDDRAALVLLSAADVDRNSSALLVRRCSLLPALTALFDAYWQLGRPLSGTGGQAQSLKPYERQLLALLAGGVTDDVAARNLGISRRTVTRCVERLMTVTGASSRFQLALNAAREGWL